MANANLIEERKGREHLLGGLVLVAIGSSIWLPWYAGWLPVYLADAVSNGHLFFLAIAVIGLAQAISGFLSLRPGHLGTQRARKLAIAGMIVWYAILIAFAVAIVVGAFWLIGGTYYLIGSEITKWLAGGLAQFPWEIMNLIALVWAIPTIGVLVSGVMRVIPAAKHAILIFVLGALVAPLAALELTSGVYFLWHTVQWWFIEDASGTRTDAFLIVLAVRMFLTVLNLLAAILLIWFIVRATQEIARTARRRIAD